MTAEVYEPRIPLASGVLCPACKHTLTGGVHVDDGCTIGWVYNGNALAVTGCPCVLTIADDQRGIL